MPDVLDVTNVGGPGDAGDKKGPQKPAKGPSGPVKKPAGRKPKIDYAAEHRKQVIVITLLVVVAVACLGYTGYWFFTRPGANVDFNAHQPLPSVTAPGSRGGASTGGSAIRGSNRGVATQGSLPSQGAGQDQGEGPAVNAPGIH